MAKPKNIQAFRKTRARLIDAGLALFRAKSFMSVGISEILNEAGAPKGSFYHYFSDKEDFGLAVAEAYHEQQMQAANANFTKGSTSPVERLRDFFVTAKKDYESRNFADGCLMCNLSTELGDQNERFQVQLSRQWAELVTVIADNMDADCLQQLRLSHLNASEAASLLLNSWSGALTRMKADRSVEPLELFLRCYFC